jgi:hypothetical protein
MGRRRLVFTAVLGVLVGAAGLAQARGGHGGHHGHHGHGGHPSYTSCDDPVGIYPQVLRYAHPWQRTPPLTTP